MKLPHLAALALALCTAHAQAEQPTLRLYNWADYFAADTLKQFTAETGIQVIYDVMDGSEVLEAKLMSGRSGYDLVFPGDTVAERLMRAGSLQKLDRSQLQALDDIDPGLRKLHDQYPKASQATVPYTWGTIGLTVNADKVRQRMPGAPLDNLDLLFKPELAAKFADCGISVIDSPDEVLAVVLNYLGREPRSAKREDLAAASELLKAIRPYVRKFQSQPVTELVNENLCLSLGYSGDVIQAQRTAPRHHGVDGHHGHSGRCQAPGIRLSFHQLRHAPGEHGCHQQLHRLPHGQRQSAPGGGPTHARQPRYLSRRSHLCPADSGPGYSTGRHAGTHACVDALQDCTGLNHAKP